MRRVLDFHGLDRRYWRIVEVTDADGERCAYRDGNARVRVGPAEVVATIDPFSRFDDTDPRRNHAKLLYLSTERLPVPASGCVECAARMAVTTHRQVPFDLVDAYGTLNLVDFTSGMVVNCAATNDTVYIVLERLAGAGREPFRYRVVLDVETWPGQAHDYAVVYRRDGGDLTVRIDGAASLRTCLPVAMDGFQLGMGVFSARDLNRFPRAERERGQGATVHWGPWTVRSA
jgi:hypothetical protein